MTRAKERGEGFRAAQVQQKRADRADERIAELRRELAASQRELKTVREELALERECSAALARDLNDAQLWNTTLQGRLDQIEAAAAPKHGLIARLRSRIVGTDRC